MSSNINKKEAEQKNYNFVYSPVNITNKIGIKKDAIKNMENFKKVTGFGIIGTSGLSPVIIYKKDLKEKNIAEKYKIKRQMKNFNYISDDNFLIDNYKSKKGYDNNNMQIITEPCYKGNIKNKEKNNFYCIKQIKEEMNEILRNKKNVNDNNYICLFSPKIL